MHLYDWNASVGSAFHADLGRLEVVIRNALDERLVDFATQRGLGSWYQATTQLFPGRASKKAVENITKAREKATKRFRKPEHHGKVIAELTFGFWRFMCGTTYQTSLWIPSLAAAFPHHPSSNPEQIRKDVEARMDGLLFLRNRIAHHEPIHERNLTIDQASLLELAGWVCKPTAEWIGHRSQVTQVLQQRP